MTGLKFSFIPGKVVLWFRVFAAGVIFLALYRLLFLLRLAELIDDSPVGEILHSFWIGFRFDSVILSIVILPLMLISVLPFVKFTKKVIRTVFILILSVIFALIFLISAADLAFFDHFGSRMNYWAVEYIEYPGLFLYSSVSHGGFWKLFAVWLIITALFIFIIRMIFRKASRFRPPAGTASRIAIYVLVTVFLTFGIRGRIGIKALDWGTAFFSENHFLNQLSLNSVFTLFHSVYEEIKDGRTLFGQDESRYAFYADIEAYETVADMLGLAGNAASGDLSLKHQIRGEPREFLPNVVIIIMESWSADRNGALGAHFGITPAFDSPASHGILFSNFYANGIRTNRGIPAILCSFPSLPGRSIMKRYAADYPFRSVADMLKEHGYTSIFAYGGDIEFDNMRGFLKAVGYDRFYSEGDFGTENRLGKWGIPDHIVFGRLIGEIGRFPRPFNLTTMTLSNHEPYLIPDERFRIYDDSVPDSRVLNTFYYSDWAVGHFMDSLRQYPVFDSTIFVFTSDHYPHQSAEYPLDPDNFHIPFLIYAPGILGTQGRTIERAASQVDIAPTVAGLLGLETEIQPWGRDQIAVADEDPGFAVIADGRKLGLIEGSRFFFHWIDATKKLYDLSDEPYLERNLMDSLPDLSRRMERRLNSYIQLAHLLSRGRKTEK
ncbi:MAG: sulfatase-like hydrolase/transferase [Candidatus Zixiibacteriota bacterium]|nr:MAG: sulfatase-like hydrolase/transferase [candidate division Zixibacteria bacterium]